MRPTIVIGSNGFLGQSVAKLLTGKRILTHRRTPKFAGSLHYDFFEDDTLPAVLSEPSTVIFTASAHMNQPTEKVLAAMRHLLKKIAEHRFIYVSSDAIFDGEKGNYSEADKPTPITEYGRNLVACEQAVKELCTDYCIVRPSYIYGFVNGELDSRLAETRAALLAGEHFTAFPDMFKSPLSYQEEATAIVKLASSDFVGTIHVAGERMSAYEFRLRAMKELGVDCANLLRTPMPSEPNMMRDTSLDNTRWRTLFNTSPKSIEKGLRLV